MFTSVYLYIGEYSNIYNLKSDMQLTNSFICNLHNTEPLLHLTQQNLVLLDAHCHACILKNDLRACKVIGLVLSRYGAIKW
jgi:hypothetical protein